MSILSVEWGKTSFNGISYKDAKVWSTSAGHGHISEGIYQWNWLEDGTKHNPGVTFEAVQELLEKLPDTIILTEGFDGVLQVSDELIKRLTDAGYKVIKTRTAQGVAMFNYLVSKNESVAMLVHSTC